MRAGHALSQVAILMVAASATAKDDRLLVDQRIDLRPLPQTFQSVQMTGPIGQEFTPSVDALDRVELFMADFDLDGHEGARVSVTLRTGSLDGPVQGKSAAVTLPDGFEGIARFDFSERVRVTPGALYVIQVSVESGDNWSVCVGADTYSRGRQIFRGTPRADSDLWFRVGLARRD